MNDKQDGLGGLLITDSDWRKVRAIEAHAQALFVEAKASAWALKDAIARDVSRDVSRLVRTGDGIKLAVIAAAIVGAASTVIHLLSATRPPSCCGDRRQGRHGWRDPS